MGKMGKTNDSSPNRATIKTSENENIRSEEGDSEYILDTMVTWYYVEQKLKKALHGKTDTNFGINKRVELIGAGQGFMSTMGRLYADRTHHQKNLPESIIVKIPSIASAKKYMENADLFDHFEQAGYTNPEETLDHYEKMIETVRVRISVGGRNTWHSDSRGSAHGKNHSRLRNGHRARSKAAR